MFPCAAKFLTLLSVILHAGLGCCAHHEHCSVPSATPSAAEPQKSNEAHRCSCAFHAHNATAAASEDAVDVETGDDSCPCGDDRQGCTDHCSWLTNSKVEVPTDHQIALPAAIADAWSERTSSASLIASNCSAEPPCLSDSKDTLRAKAQVWRL